MVSWQVQGDGNKSSTYLCYCVVKNYPEKGLSLKKGKRGQSLRAEIQEFQGLYWANFKKKQTKPKAF